MTTGTQAPLAINLTAGRVVREREGNQRQREESGERKKKQEYEKNINFVMSETFLRAVSTVDSPSGKKPLRAIHFKFDLLKTCNLRVNLILCSTLQSGFFFSVLFFYTSSSRTLCLSPSLDMPTERHFLKRQCWHRFRFMRMMRQFSFFTHIL